MKTGNRRQVKRIVEIVLLLLIAAAAYVFLPPGLYGLAAIVFLIWFIVRRWKGPPPRGWKSDDGGATWRGPER